MLEQVFPYTIGVHRSQYVAKPKFMRSTYKDARLSLHTFSTPGNILNGPMISLGAAIARI